MHSMLVLHAQEFLERQAELADAQDALAALPSDADERTRTAARDAVADARDELDILKGEYDPTPWCHHCGARRQSACDCPRPADNE